MKNHPDAYLFGIPLYKVEVPLYDIPNNIEFNLKDIQEKRAKLFEAMIKRMEKVMNIDQQIEIVKLIQRIFDNCSEGEVSIGGDVYTSKLELFDICRAIENTLQDLVNEKLRDVSY